MPPHFDVAVVGTGPAGASAARDLAARGCRVVLLETETLPRYKTCGGGLVHRAIRWLPFDISDAVERDCHRADLHLAKSGLHFRTRRERPVVVMTMRDRFDCRLTQEAVESGAELWQGCPLIGLAADPRRLLLETARGSVSADWVIAADGAHSPTARAAGFAPNRGLIPALECEVKVPPEIFDRFSSAARFDFEIVPEGYAWVFPKRDHLSMGVLSMTRRKAGLKVWFERYLSHLAIDRIESCDRHGFVIPVQPRPGGFVGGRILLVGDAAGLAEPVTGEGISFSIRSGQLAARALAQGGLQQSQVGARYTGFLRDEILGELRLGRMVAWLAYRRSKLWARLLRIYGDRLCESLTDVMMGECSYREIARSPRSYLELLRVW